MSWYRDIKSDKISLFIEIKDNDTGASGFRTAEYSKGYYGDEKPYIIAYGTLDHAQRSIAMGKISEFKINKLEFDKIANKIPSYIKNSQNNWQEIDIKYSILSDIPGCFHIADHQINQSDIKSAMSHPHNNLVDLLSDENLFLITNTDTLDNSIKNYLAVANTLINKYFRKSESNYKKNFYSKFDRKNEIEYDDGIIENYKYNEDEVKRLIDRLIKVVKLIITCIHTVKKIRENNYISDIKHDVERIEQLIFSIDADHVDADLLLDSVKLAERAQITTEHMRMAFCGILDSGPKAESLLSAFNEQLADWQEAQGIIEPRIKTQDDWRVMRRKHLEEQSGIPRRFV